MCTVVIHAPLHLLRLALELLKVLLDILAARILHIYRGLAGLAASQSN